MSMLYRYFDVKGLVATIETESLRIAKISSLNDPFDFNPSVKFAAVDDKELREFYRQNQSVHGLDITTMTNADLQKHRLLKEADLSPSMMRDIADKRFGVICFSKLPDSSLMWAHYAEKHSGGNIGFHIEGSPFSDMRERDLLFDINYQIDRPVFYHHPTDKAFWIKQFYTSISIKGKFWDYENEVRAIFPIGDLGKIKSRFFEKNGYSYLCMRPNEWKEVRFGLYAESSTIQKVMQLATEKGMNDCKFFKAVLKKDKFHIEFEPLS